MSEVMTREERLARLETMISEGRIIRRSWGDRCFEEWYSNDKKRLCLLAALSPEAGFDRSASSCPSYVMPPWLAFMTLMLDFGSDEQWTHVLRRYAALAHKWHTLDELGWRRAKYSVLAACVREAMKYTADGQALECCQVMISLCERTISGHFPSPEEWSSVRAMAEGITKVSVRGTCFAAWTVFRASASDEKAVSNAAWDAACASTDSERLPKDAWFATWDGIIVALFDAIETELGRLEDQFIDGGQA